MLFDEGYNCSERILQSLQEGINWLQVQVREGRRTQRTKQVLAEAIDVITLFS